MLVDTPLVLDQKNTERQKDQIIISWKKFWKRLKIQNSVSGKVKKKGLWATP